MKSTHAKKNEINKIDRLFVKAVDQIIMDSKKAGIKPDSYRGINLVIYPASQGLISRVNKGKSHITHTALINFAKHYNVNMNYFYHDDVDFEYDLNNFLPAHKQVKKTEATPEKIKLEDIDFSEVDIEKEISFEHEELAKKFKLDTQIRIFANLLPKDASQFFYNILHIIQFDYETKLIELKDKIGSLDEKLKKTYEKIQIVQENENNLLKKLINEK
ncbi:hypothetical protein U8527_10290 [Kordia algicida OT-1]|uniref:Uncharacterized protein n=1 Tax=Kordia algicida OT-1 TaxID=391587 RepID=A9DW08_9FLAO|nr:hypothetical protein [Kordia algicida]EDP96493.1 hypothetical protein KAOT1_03752 [Kordia algicida OT-1]